MVQTVHKELRSKCHATSGKRNIEAQAICNADVLQLLILSLQGSLADSKAPACRHVFVPRLRRWEIQVYAEDAVRLTREVISGKSLKLPEMEFLRASVRRSRCLRSSTRMRLSTFLSRSRRTDVPSLVGPDLLKDSEPESLASTRHKPVNCRYLGPQECLRF